MKRAQIEMMGFVMVVILVTIGLFFAVSLRQPESSTKRTLTVYSDEKLASNFLITLLETNIAEDIKVHDYAVDCVRQHVKDQGKYSVDTCVATEDIVEQILEDTLGAWGYSYEFTFTYTDASNNPDILITNASATPCLGEIAAPGLQPISLFRVTTGSALMRLDVCA